MTTPFFALGLATAVVLYVAIALAIHRTQRIRRLRREPRPAAQAAAALTGRQPVLDAEEIGTFLIMNGWRPLFLSGHFAGPLFPGGFHQEVRVSGERPYWRVEVGWSSAVTGHWYPITARPLRVDTLLEVEGILAQAAPTSCPPPREIAA